MNVNGVLGSMCFPSMTGFCGQLFSRTPDRDLGYRLLQGYNNWHIDEWCGTYPGRFMPLAIVPIWDVDLMAAEIYRVAEKGCRAVTFSENPPSWGTRASTPTTGTRSSAACEETGTVVCLHIGSSSSISVTSDDAPVDVMITTTPVNLFMCRGRPHLVADLPQVPQPEDRALRGRHRLDPVLPRPHRLHLPAPQGVDATVEWRHVISWRLHRLRAGGFVVWIHARDFRSFPW